MKLQYRIFFALIFILIVAILGAHTLASSRGFKPLTEQLISSRADILMTVADEIKESENPKARAQRLQRRLKVHIELSRRPFPFRKHIRKKILVEDTEITVLNGPTTPMIVKLEDGERFGYIMIKFPVDIDAPKRKSGVALLWLGLICGLGAWLLSRWALRPLQTATNAMNRIADGDLGHRVSDPIGMTGTVFNRMADRVEGLVSEQRRWVAAISHELRTPMTRLRLQAEILDDQETKKSLLEDISDLESLAETMIASAKLNSEAIPIQLSDIDLESLIMTSLGSVELHDREIHLELQSTMNLTGDWDLLLRVINNILSNISRYTPETAKVWISSEDVDECVWITIADNGLGVSKELRSQIFDPFVRAETSRAKVTGGLGLGLMLVKQIVERHHGQVIAEEHQTGGLQIRFSLPLLQAGYK